MKSRGLPAEQTVGRGQLPGWLDKLARFLEPASRAQEETGGGLGLVIPPGSFDMFNRIEAENPVNEEQVYFDSRPNHGTFSEEWLRDNPPPTVEEPDPDGNEVNKRTHGWFKLPDPLKESAKSFGVTDETLERLQYPFVYYNQGDYGDVPYPGGVDDNKNATVASGGCGPTSMAIVLANMVDSKITPREMAEDAMVNGFRLNEDNGTNSGFFKDVGERYGLKVEVLKDNNQENFDKVKQALRDGDCMVVTSVGTEHFTNSSDGHYIILAGISYEAGKEKFIVIDPYIRPGKYDYGVRKRDIKVLRKGTGIVEVDADIVRKEYNGGGYHIVRKPW